jgi:hypothetical protein
MHINAVYQQSSECFAGTFAAGHSSTPTDAARCAYGECATETGHQGPRQKGEQALTNMSEGVRQLLQVHNATYICAHCTIAGIAEACCREGQLHLR